MTVCIAAICNGGKSVVVCADRMFTNPGLNVEFETSERKIEQIGNACVVMPAGNSVNATEVIEDVRRKLGRDPKPKFPDIAETFRLEYANVRNKMVYQNVIVPMLGAGTGQVPGSILNQFSVSESGSYFFIVTTTGSLPANNLYVLADTDPELGIVGQLEGFAPGWSIQAMQFIGNSAFVSTAGSDLTLDLSNPTAPFVVATRPQPASSMTCKPSTRHILIGIGQDYSQNYSGHVAISLFDIDDLSNPTLASSYEVLPDGYSWSDAEYDHQVITYDPTLQALAVPFSGYGMVNGANGSEMSQTGVMVLHIDGGVLLSQGQFSDNSGVQRNVFIGGLLYSLSNYDIQVHSLDDLNTLTQELQYSPPAWIRSWGSVGAINDQVQFPQSPWFGRQEPGAVWPRRRRMCPYCHCNSAPNPCSPLSSNT